MFCLIWKRKRPLSLPHPIGSWKAKPSVCPLNQAPTSLHLVRLPQAAGCVLVSVACRRIHFNWAEGWGYRETIDCNGRQIDVHLAKSFNMTGHEEE